MASALLHGGMLTYGLRYWWPLARLADNPDAAQARVLARILRANRDTDFGREHRFDNIASIEDFRAAVAIHDFEALRRYVDRQRRTGRLALTCEQPRFYAHTSGSTGQPKHIPITPSLLRLHQSEQALFTYLQYRSCPDAFAGKAFGIMGAAVEGYLDSGHPVGSVSGYLYELLPRPVRSRFVIPPGVSTIADYDLKYLVMLRLALGTRDITYLGSPNPSTFLRLLELLEQRRDTLAASLETGTLPELEAAPESARRAVLPLLHKDSARARELSGTGRLSFERLWPPIKLLTTWTGGSCGIALDKLRSLLPAETRVMELGYQSTEFRGTIAITPETSAGLPLVHHHVFEFVSQDDWDSGCPVFKQFSELEQGGRYFVVITTAAGLYRYFMNDLVEVNGRFSNTPLLRFVQKGKGVTSLTGEKLYEGQVIQAVQDVSRGSRVAARFFILVADARSASYTLYIECDDRQSIPLLQFATAVDERLRALNHEYESKRSSGRLPPLTVSWIAPGAAEAYKAACIGRGQREGQFKPAVLQYAVDLPLSLDAYVCS
jgi:hypothetical protein